MTYEGWGRLSVHVGLASDVVELWWGWCGRPVT